MIYELGEAHINFLYGHILGHHVLQELNKRLITRVIFYTHDYFWCAIQ